jgi:hypothetical protein
MRTIVIAAIMFVVSNAAQATDFVLDLAGKGVEGRPPYRGGGSVRLVDAGVAAQLVHYRRDELRLPLAIRYEVLKTAPVLLTSRLVDVLREQIGMIRTMGIHGYCLFAYSHLDDAQVKMLTEEINREPAVPYYRFSARR